jgi:hypothetical protein
LAILSQFENFDVYLASTAVEGGNGSSDAAEKSVKRTVTVTVTVKEEKSRKRSANIEMDWREMEIP